ncbi:MAG: sigma-54-dependent Fis family transcriptional regulator [Planctomycetes bacterium]|nr:sigma-54-dependent Fis family transcriptional regulator [Planctomycetota bacterium]
MIRKVAIINNNPTKRQELAAIFSAQGCDITLADDGFELLNTVTEGCDAAIVETGSIDIWDDEFLAKFREVAPDLPLVLTVQSGKIESYVAMLSTGAWDYLTEPFSEEAVRLMLRRLEEQQALLEQKRYLLAELEQAAGEPKVITRDPRMIQILRQVNKVAATDSSVLILGEKGTEKARIARLIHNAGPGKSCPFIRIDCTLPEEESIGRLFGAAGESFAALSAGGTVFLDEITHISPDAQAKLLRMLDGKARPRVISSSSDDPFEQVERGHFREDLFFRLNASQIFLPPLRERTGDVHLLANELMQRHGMAKPELGWDELEEYDWPGNVSELEAAVLLAALRRSDCANAADDLLPTKRRTKNRRRFRREKPR